MRVVVGKKKIDQLQVKKGEIHLRPSIIIINDSFEPVVVVLEEGKDYSLNQQVQPKEEEE